MYVMNLLGAKFMDIHYTKGNHYLIRRIVKNF